MQHCAASAVVVGACAADITGLETWDSDPIFLAAGTGVPFERLQPEQLVEKDVEQPQVQQLEKLIAGVGSFDIQKRTRERKQEAMRIASRDGGGPG